MGNLISAAALIRVNTVLRGIATFLEEKLGKGRTIRKVMGGRGIFELQEFFSLSDSLHEFYLGHCMNIF